MPTCPSKKFTLFGYLNPPHHGLTTALVLVAAEKSVVLLQLGLVVHLHEVRPRHLLGGPPAEAVALCVRLALGVAAPVTALLRTTVRLKNGKNECRKGFARKG